MASDLGVKALIEFEAKGQREVIAQAEGLTKELGSVSAAGGEVGTNFQDLATQLATGGGLADKLHSALMGMSPPVAALAASFGGVLAAANAVGDEIDGWAEGFNQASLASRNQIDRLLTQMQDLRSEGERLTIGQRLRAEISQLQNELGNFQFNESLERSGALFADAVRDLVAGFDIDDATEQALQNRIAKLQELQARLATQPLAVADDSAKRAEEEAKRRAQAEAQLRESLGSLGEARGEVQFRADLNAAGDDPLKQMEVIQDRLIAQREKLNQLEAEGFNARTMSAEEISRREAAIARLLGETQRLQEQMGQAEAKAWQSPKENEKRPEKPVNMPLLEINADRLTRNGATLGDPAAPKDERLGFGKAPHFYMDQANDVRAKALAEAMLHRAATPKGLDAAAALGPRGDAGAAPVINTDGLYRVSNSKDPAYYQEQANRLLQEIRDEMRASNRVTYDQPGAYED